MDLRERCLNANDLPSESVRVPEWDADLCVRTLTVGERADLEQLTAGMASKEIMAHWVVAATVDDKGAKVFQLGDAARLMGKSASAMLRLFDVLAKLNRIGKADVEELAKN